MKTAFVVTLFNLISLFAFGQSNVELKVQLLESDLIAEATLDKDPFFEWVNSINNEIETHLKGEEGNKEVLVIISLHKNSDATIDIASRPKLEKGSIQALKDKISKYKSPKTKITDYSFVIIARVNEGGDKDMEFVPAITFPQERSFTKYKELSMEEKDKALRNWVRDEVIPIVAYFEKAVDAKYEGVLNVGEMLGQGKYIDGEVDSYTTYNPDYWRAIMEMAGGNQLIPFTKMCMHIVNGEYDKAKRLLFLVGLFSEESTLPAAFHKELSSKLGLLINELNSAINEGISLHDKGKYKEAVAHYNKLLKTFPDYAWLNYELYYSKVAGKNIDETANEWDKAKEIIYKCDPMYSMSVNAKSGKEGYLLLKRQEINMLFQSKENLKPDIIKYADTALDLGDYGFAAHLYWFILNYFTKEEYANRNMLAHYLYCLDKLGNKESIKNFEGDFVSEFEKIEQERRRIMVDSEIYQSFEKKD